MHSSYVMHKLCTFCGANDQYNLTCWFMCRSVFQFPGKVKDDKWVMHIFAFEKVKWCSNKDLRDKGPMPAGWYSAYNYSSPTRESPLLLFRTSACCD